MLEVWEATAESLQALGTNPLELLGVIFGLACVTLNALENIWGWPTGLVSVGIYIFIFFDVRLYADMVLNVFFFITGVYGWYHWLTGGEKRDDLPITRSGLRDWGLYVAIGIVGLILIGLFFDTYTDADLAYWDAYTTSFSLVAQVLMARKKLENWLIWIAVDIIATGIYWYKGLYLTAFMFAVYLILATVGYLNWRKRMQAQTAIA
jgi:nicotinamide mononucleotide transporter